MKIRDDLEGVVYVQTAEGVVVLAAGDTVPDGGEVGDHLIAPAASTRGRKANGADAAS